MIGKSYQELVFIRLSIFLLSAVPYLATIYSVSFVFHRKRLPWMLDCWLFAEFLFHVFVYLPRRKSLQKAAAHPPAKQRTDRRALLERCLSYIPELDRFNALWFQTSFPIKIRRDNLIDWLLWALFSTNRESLIDDPSITEELNEYLAMIEKKTGQVFQPGMEASCKPMRLTLDPVVMLPRPVMWYLIVAIIDCISYASLHAQGLRHFSPSLRTKVFPPRPQTLFSRWSVASNIPYWYRQHKSSKKLPVVILHGIGIGLWPYVPFIAELAKLDSDVGILILEILPISMRITRPVLSPAQFVEQLTHILVLHNILEFVLLSHSYGSVLTTHILRSSLGPRVSSVVLVDPVTFLLYLPDVAYNFVYRKPRMANEWQLWYFASRDMGVSHALSRHFFWADNILWKEDLDRRKFGVVLSEQDQILNSREVWRYLMAGQEEEPTKLWNEKGDLIVLWYSQLDHAQVFDTAERRQPILALVEKFITLD